MRRSNSIRSILFNRLPLIAAIVLLPQLTHAQTYTLDQILDSVERNNPSLLAYQNRIRSIEENAKSARAWMPPRVGVELDMLPYNLNADKGSSLRFSGWQDFPVAKRNSAKESYMRSMATTEEYGGSYHKVQLFAAAKETYYKIYISQRKIAVLKEGSQLLKLMIDLATKQMAITKGDLASIYRLKARLEQNESSILHEENVIRSLYATMNYLMNEDVNRQFEIDTASLVKSYRGLNTYVNVDSIDYKRSDIMGLKSEITTMKLNQQYILLRGKPEFGMKAEHYERFGGMPNAFALMGTMTIPSAPWSAKSYKHEAHALDSRVLALEQDKQNLANMAMQLIKMYLIELESEYKEMDNYSQKVVPAFRKGLDANLLAYGQNTTDMYMALMAWDDLLMAQMEFLKHLDTYLKVQTEYEKELEIR
jgi:hypothetical protein